MKYLVFSIIVILACNKPLIEDFFESIELKSTKGESIYINTSIWGVTGDHQATIVTKNKKRLKNDRNDRTGTTERFSPFIYSFQNDTLHLFFRDTLTYSIDEKFKTIHVNYVLLDNPMFSKLAIEAKKNEKYFFVPRYAERKYPSDIPKAPNE